MQWDTYTPLQFELLKALKVLPFKEDGSLDMVQFSDIHESVTNNIVCHEDELRIAFQELHDKGIVFLRRVGGANKTLALITLTPKGISTLACLD